ncbi:unnamed protein product [Protopolystoma xenopodis]|uniref:Uncharacterized protein n=1 Tax=Protopolystoma xenopodis TaxID=117903 RepID=A0A448WJG5_9PLAT|nr:unnamed protein product [Protopolystoma xenopodis]
MATFADKIVKDFVFVGGTNYQNNFLAEDFADRMSSTYTSAILLAICAVHITRVYFFSSIDCLLPSSATPEAAYRAYSDNICWAIGTVPVLANESLPRTKEDWEELYNKRGIGRHLV